MNFNVTFVRWYYNASSCVCAGAWHEPSPTASEPRRPASTDDLTVEPRGELDRRRRTRSRGSFGALTLILQQVKRQVQKNIQECDSRVHSPSGAKSSLVPLSKTRGSVFCVVILVARRRRDLRGLVSGVDVCVCVCATTAAARVCRLLPDASIEHLRERPGRARRPFPVWDSIEGL